MVAVVMVVHGMWLTRRPFGKVAYFEMCHSRSLGKVANLKD
jgi:hypothetical protein